MEGKVDEQRASWKGAVEALKRVDREDQELSEPQGRLAWVANRFHHCSQGGLAMESGPGGDAEGYACRQELLSRGASSPWNCERLLNALGVKLIKQLQMKEADERQGVFSRVYQAGTGENFILAGNLNQFDAFVPVIRWGLLRARDPGAQEVSLEDELSNLWSQAIAAAGDETLTPFERTERILTIIEQTRDAAVELERRNWLGPGRGALGALGAGEKNYG